MKNAKVKTPLKSGFAKTPVVMQMEALECGAASLTMILAYYGKWIPLERLRSDCGVSRDGSNAKNIAKAAQNYGLRVRAFRYEPEELRENGIFPCIVHWEFNHFIVVNGFKGDRVSVNDPARGNYIMTMEDFDKGFTGICLTFEPGEDFQPEGKPKSVLAFARKRLAGAESALVFVLLTTVISALTGIIFSGFARVFLDQLLTGRNPEWLTPFLAGFAGIALLQITAEWIQALYAIRINGKLAVMGNTSYLWKVLHLPVEFFTQRMAGDIHQRQITNESIAGDLVNTLAPLVLQTAMMIFYLVVMLRYSPLLSAIGLAALAGNIWVSGIISAKRINITRIMMRDSGNLAAATVSGIEMIETIKSSGAENGYFEKWSGYQASVNTQTVRFQRINQHLGLIPALLTTLANVLVLSIGVWLCMRGEFTTGMLFAFQGFLTSFMTPAQSLISAEQTFQEMRTRMERVEDVMEYRAPDELSGTAEDRPDTENTMDSMEDSGNLSTEKTGDLPDTAEMEEETQGKLSGAVSLRHVTFGYSRLAPPLIRDFSMELQQGSKVAFVGASGCGKSTLSKLISGLYKPWEGEILFDGKPAGKIDRSIFTGSVAVVDQDIILFEDTIANNIKMWDESIEDFEMIMAARDAQLHEDIMQRNGGYQYRITEGGRDFSGGQRQRMEIARVLAQDPTIIILDEATSALDAKTEFNVVNSIRDRGVTCIVVAHRLSTVRDCDEIIVLDKGEVVERGTHEELMNLHGAYEKLVSSE